MAHSGFAAGSGAARTFDAMRRGGEGEHFHPHDHPDLAEAVDNHADMLNEHDDRLDDHDDRLSALEAHDGHDGG